MLVTAENVAMARHWLERNHQIIAENKDLVNVVTTSRWTRAVIEPDPPEENPPEPKENPKALKAQKLPTKLRNCLRCSQPFPSTSSGNRICRECAKLPGYKDAVVTQTGHHIGKQIGHDS